MRDCAEARDREVRRGGVGHAVPSGIGDGDFARTREFARLLADAVHEHDLDRPASATRRIDEEVAEVVVGHHGAIESDDEDLPLEARHVFPGCRGDRSAIVVALAVGEADPLLVLIRDGNALLSAQTPRRVNSPRA